MGRLFGTDGIRGIANRDLSIQRSAQVGQALATVLRERLGEGRKPRVFIGKDTRLSSDMIEAALAAGLCAGGVDCVALGVVPTPAVAYLTVAHGMDAGVMISASHNPFQFNGIKIFGPKGYKLTDREEAEIEDMILDDAIPMHKAEAGEIGRYSQGTGLAEEYIRHIAATLPGEKPLRGMRVLADCANGSASRTAKELFALLGAEADVICREPDGVNVNRDCGSTHMESLRQRVKAGGYALGVAFDGDADRCLAVDEKGELVDGDQMIAIFATRMKEKGTLKKNTAVVTVMSNYGFMNFARQSGIDVKTTKVGDRYVLETMLAEGYNIGGEQSGHIIFTDHMTTGDGQLSAVQLMGVMQETGKPLSQLTEVITILPQVLVNMEATVDMKAGLAESLEISAAVRACEEELRGEGRVLIRPSGTEPLIRVMVEGPEQRQIEDIARRIVAAIREALS
ncbi:MAG: phosphoglucosamine mutase [Angelakisella sp.]|jgi:phosphoglucosamine mutase|nr:phosphoglucosamine mutase [Angelakisella sp.]